MTIWILVILIAAAWSMYPITGILSVGALVAAGSRPKDAGFSFLPELILFPALFLGTALVIDYFAFPWGRWIVGTLCIIMLVYEFYSCIACVQVIRRHQKQEPHR